MRLNHLGAALAALLLVPPTLGMPLSTDAFAQSTCDPSTTSCPPPNPTPTPNRPRRDRPSSYVPSRNSNLGLGVGLGTAGLAAGIAVYHAVTRSPSSWRVPDDVIETGPPPARQANQDSERDPPRKKVKKIKKAKLEVQPSQPGQTPPTPPPAEAGRPGFSVPAETETRYVQNEVLVVLRDGATAAQIARLERALGLTPLSTERIALINAEVRRYRLKPGKSVASVVTSLSNRSFVARAQPNYLFELQLDPAPKLKTAQLAEPGGGDKGGTPDQYALGALRLPEAQKLAKGKGISIAVIDSGVDETNPDLKDTVTDHFDALGAPFKPHAHGTAIGGAIVANRKLKGIAPEARLLAIRTFVGATAGANGTSFDILRGVDYAAAHGARILNMSFAGPQDALLKSAIDASLKRGIVTIAAAGNGGPRAKPLFPGAEPGVIAVTATDANGKPYAKANRGSYVAVAAPGVDILAPGLGDSVQITSGTSIATAEASGVVALILERKPNATPEEIRQILKQTATRLTVEPEATGAGLINAADAIGKK